MLPNQNNFVPDSLGTTPSTTNYAFKNRFQFIIKNLPNVTFFLQKLTIPGIMCEPIDLATSTDRNLPISGDVVHFETLVLEFILSEDLSNHQEIFNWIVNNAAGNFTRSDAQILFLDNKSENAKTLYFEGAFPFELSRIDLDRTVTADEPILLTASFAYVQWYYYSPNQIGDFVETN